MTTIVDTTTGETTELQAATGDSRTDAQVLAAADLVNALAALQEISKAGSATVPTKSGGSYRYKYLELPDLLTEVRTKFATHGLAVMQEAATVEGGVAIRTVILHRTGETFTSPPLTLRCSTLPQDIGGAITYGRRYSLATMVGLAGDEDLDAHPAQQQDRQEYAQNRPAQRTQGTPQDPENDRWQSPPTQPTRPASDPISPQEMPDRPASGTPRKASANSKKMMWALLNKTGMTNDQIRDWVAAVMPDVGPDWHTDALLQSHVSALIDRLKAEATDEPTTTPQQEEGTTP